jgi:hypothetical protein
MIVLLQEKANAPFWLIFKINIGELLSGPAAHDEAGVEFFNGKRRGEEGTKETLMLQIGPQGLMGREQDVEFLCRSFGVDLRHSGNRAPHKNNQSMVSRDWAVQRIHERIVGCSCRFCAAGNLGLPAITPMIGSRSTSWLPDRASVPMLYLEPKSNLRYVAKSLI